MLHPRQKVVPLLDTYTMSSPTTPALVYRLVATPHGAGVKSPQPLRCLVPVCCSDLFYTAIARCCNKSWKTGW